MNYPLTRTALYVTGIGAAVWAFIASFWSATAFLTLLAFGMVTLIVAGYLEYQK